MGGELLRELSGYSKFAQWLYEVRRTERVRIILDEEVDSETDALREMDVCRSDDEHILALARVGGVRLLFTNDADLQADFNDSAIINHPRGKIYTTLVHEDTTSTHRSLLSPRNIRQLCRFCN